MTNTDGSPYQATTAWKDLFNAIQEAQKFIYITGWSVYTEIALVRGEDDPDGESNVGELLKRKADEGVKVLLMVWNEKLSTENNPGLMGTHDEETRMYFEGTAVECMLVPRAKTEGILASQFVGTCYTHHQKTVIVDAPISEDDQVCWQLVKNTHNVFQFLMKLVKISPSSKLSTVKFSKLAQLSYAAYYVPSIHVDCLPSQYFPTFTGEPPAGRLRWRP